MLAGPGIYRDGTPTGYEVTSQAWALRLAKECNRIVYGVMEEDEVADLWKRVQKDPARRQDFASALCAQAEYCDKTALKKAASVREKIEGHAKEWKEFEKEMKKQEKERKEAEKNRTDL